MEGAYLFSEDAEEIRLSLGNVSGGPSSDTVFAITYSLKGLRGFATQEEAKMLCVVADHESRFRNPIDSRYNVALHV